MPEPSNDSVAAPKGEFGNGANAESARSNKSSANLSKTVTALDQIKQNIQSSGTPAEITGDHAN